jgi:hypothetical protein
VRRTKALTRRSRRGPGAAGHQRRHGGALGASVGVNGVSVSGSWWRRKRRGRRNLVREQRRRGLAVGWPERHRRSTSESQQRVTRSRRVRAWVRGEREWVGSGRGLQPSRPGQLGWTRPLGQTNGPSGLFCFLFFLCEVFIILN